MEQYLKQIWKKAADADADADAEAFSVETDATRIGGDQKAKVSNV